VTTAPAGPAFTLQRLAALVGATLEGDGDRLVSAVAALESAGPTDISFVLGRRLHVRKPEAFARWLRASFKQARPRRTAA